VHFCKYNCRPRLVAAPVQVKRVILRIQDLYLPCSGRIALCTNAPTTSLGGVETSDRCFLEIAPRGTTRKLKRRQNLSVYWTYPAVMTARMGCSAPNSGSQSERRDNWPARDNHPRAMRDLRVLSASNFYAQTYRRILARKFPKHALSTNG
jgi:hypothetical protein